MITERQKKAMDAILLALVGSTEMVETWWSSPNRAFDGKTPLEALAVDHRDVVEYLLSQTTGDYL